MRMLVVAVVTLLSLAPAFSARAQESRFVNIADSTGPLSTQFVAPTINGPGTVAFRGTFDAGGRGLFTGTGGPLTTVVNTGGPFSDLGRPAINDHGTLAFWASHSDSTESALYTAAGGTVTQVIDASGRLFRFDQGPAINNAGTISFSAEWRNSPGSRDGKGIYRLAPGSGTVTTIFETPSISTGPMIPYGPVAMNDAGTVFFDAERVSDHVWGLYAGGGGEVTNVANSSTPRVSVGAHAVNDAGAVAFHDPGFYSFIRVADGGNVVTVADTIRGYDFLNHVAISDAGTVVFTAIADGASFYGLYSGDDPVADKVIGPGDPLFGSTLRNVLGISEGFDDAGNVAFLYELENGVRGIATVRVPEPSAVAPAALAAAVLLRRRARQLSVAS